MANDLSAIQYELLKIYKEIKKVCDKYGLRYFAEGGTALGAYRHKGFIPWDDDMDLLMPLEDIYRLMEVFPKEAPEHLEAFWFTVEGRLLKVHNKNTTSIEWLLLHKPLDYEGVAIDIFPLIGVPGNLEEAQAYVTNTKALWKRTSAHYLNTKDAPKKVPEYWDMITRCSFDSAAYTIKSIGSLFCGRSYWEAPVSFPFEDTEIYLPQNTHKFLSRLGKYEELPPEEERVSHHGVQATVDLTTPYSRYAEFFKNLDEWFIDSLVQNTRTCSIYRVKKFASKVQRMEKTLDMTRRQLVGVQNEIAQIYASKTWKIGNALLAPLRALKKRLLFRKSSPDNFSAE